MDLPDLSNSAKTNVAALPSNRDCQVNVWNFKKLQAEPPSAFDFIRFDPNNNCNLHCVYCHNPQTDDRIDTAEFQAFLESHVISTNNFQVGCIMEPTMDSRLCDLLLLIAQSKAKPKNQYALQTNGILLHRHDFGKMRAAGINNLSVSVDAAEQDTTKTLRGGTNLSRVTSNIKSFHEAYPACGITFVTTVTSANVTRMADLVRLGLDLGVGYFIFREIFYHPESEVVNHAKMPDLLLKDNQFALMQKELTDKFKTTGFLFVDEPTLNASVKKIISDSSLEA